MVYFCNTNFLKLQSRIREGLLFSFFSLAILFVLHHIPFNQLFIDPFSEAIKNHDVTDIALSDFREKTQADFDKRVFIINSGITNRNEIYKITDYLLRHHVKVIGIDILFDSLEHKGIDTLLASQFADDRVILGYTFERNNHDVSPSSDEKRIDTLHRSHAFFSDNATESYVNLGSNDGFAVRTFNPLIHVDSIDYLSFGLSLALKYDSTVLTDIKTRNNDKEWINYRRLQPGRVNFIYPINSKHLTHYNTISSNKFLADTIKFPDDYFENKIVLIGFMGENEKALSMNDRYYTPLNEQNIGKSLPDMYGVVIHANIISMLLNRDFIDDVPENILYLIAFFVFFINYFIIDYLTQKKLFLTTLTVRLVQVFEFILLLTTCIILLAHFNIKLGFIMNITAVVLSLELFEFFNHKLKPKVEKYYNILLEKLKEPNSA